MNSTQFIFDGHILSELSSQIPSDIFALNELIKNSYDAMANTINIALNTQNKTLTITDDGKGMGQEEILELLHISHSSKKYGTLNNNRYIQGSKGLGALSALRFGTQVTWTTRKNNIETNLTINRDDAIKNENLTSYKIPTKIKETHDKHGTSITMQLTDDIQQTLEDELRNPLISGRIVYAFLPKTETRRDNPNDVDIQILINGKTIAQRYHPALNIASIMPNRQRAEITYNSEKTNTASIIRNGTEIKRIPLEPIPSDNFTVHLHLVYFKLDGIKKEERETIPPLFKTEKRTTTPQIFINENLFDSPDLFDPEINRSKKGGQSVPNFIGYVCINSDKIDFNPDRTQLSETPLNKKIKAFLASINSQLQKEVAKYPPIEETSGNTSEPTVADNLNTPETAAENIGTTNDTEINGDNTQTADAPDNSSVGRKQPEGETASSS
ncbi:MAG: ATP-binding protein [Scardovia wiggsiae]|uniref:ATP-binding protein n=1 Tax=Scardovia wiggsiae TaxID=230143 RepID=UPI001CAE2B70|nr:ATP-binding protein [Scardovia wiggsiae]